MGSKSLLWSPAHPAVIDTDGGVFHRMWCPDVRDDDGTTGSYVGPDEALMWDDAPRPCATCRSGDA